MTSKRFLSVEAKDTRREITRGAAATWHVTEGKVEEEEV